MKIIRKTMAIFAAAAMLSGTAFAENVSRGDTADYLLNAADYYNAAAKRSDIIKGDENGNLAQERDVTRAEALVMLHRAFGDIPAPTGHNARVMPQGVNTVNLPQWANDETLNVLEAGIITDETGAAVDLSEAITKMSLKRM